jgi:hypothetical protein
MMFLPSCGPKRLQQLRDEIDPYIDKTTVTHYTFDLKLVEDAPDSAKRAYEEFMDVMRDLVKRREEAKKMGFC